MFDFETSIEGRKVIQDLETKMRDSGLFTYKRDIKQLVSNIYKLLNEFSSLEVSARRSGKTRNLTTKKQEIIDALMFLDKLIFFETLKQ